VQVVGVGSVVGFVGFGVGVFPVSTVVSSSCGRRAQDQRMSVAAPKKI